MWRIANEKDEKLYDEHLKLCFKGSSEEEIEEVADSWMGLKDREQLEQFAARLYKLDNAEAAVDHSLFLLRLFVRTHQKLPLFSWRHRGFTCISFDVTRFWFTGTDISAKIQPTTSFSH